MAKKKSIHQDDPRRTSVDAPTQKHTPGPWSWLDLEKDVHGSFCSDALQGPVRTRDVESVAYGGGAQWTGAIIVPNGADAHLIAAAPDFKIAAERALTNAEETIEDIDTTYPEMNGAPEWINEVRERAVRTRDDARAAIAKAEGGPDA